jgi:hypothetical protein
MANYILLERIELNASAASVTFANIPQTGYTDLKIVLSCRNVTNTETVGAVYFNSDTTDGNYRYRRLLGDGSSASSLSGNNPYWFYMDTTGETASTFANCEIYIPNYTSSNQKSISSDIVTENNATSALAVLTAGLWTNTAAITSIQIRPYSAGGGNFAINSTFSLYGLAATGTTPTIAPKASGGNVIDYDGTYWIHTFNTNGTFTPQIGLTCDYLVVAGGGGAGGVVGGGGGAGGLRSTVTATGGGGSLETALSVASGTAYTITVGAGGAGGNGNADGASGNDSIFSTITSTAGGGGAHNTRNGLTGGSGGGGANANGTTAGTGGARTASPVQGFAGGNANNNVFATGASGGGGGGGSVGAAGSGATGGAGGSGTTTSISGSSVAYAGGGGGWGGTTAGTATAGGGASASGSGSANGTSGTTNRGGGGGGAANGGIGGTGGSGIVIIRYPAA